MALFARLYHFAGLVGFPMRRLYLATSAAKTAAGRRSTRNAAAMIPPALVRSVVEGVPCRATYGVRALTRCFAG